MEIDTKVINGILHYKGIDQPLMETRWFPIEEYLGHTAPIKETK